MRGGWVGGSGRVNRELKGRKSSQVVMLMSLLLSPPPALPSQGKALQMRGQEEEEVMGIELFKAMSLVS